MNPLRLLRDLLSALHGGSDPRHAAAGFALGAAWGLLPKGNLLGALVFLLFFFLRVNKSAALAAAALFTPLAYALDGPAHALGAAVLTAPALRPLWTRLYALPLAPWTRFNNTVVMGCLLLGAALMPPVYLASLRLLALYRERWASRVESLRLVRAVRGLGWYRAYREWLG